MATVYFEDVAEGQEVFGYSRNNDPWPFHVDGEAARASPLIDGVPPSGLLKIATEGNTAGSLELLAPPSDAPSGEALPDRLIPRGTLIAHRGY